LAVRALVNKISLAAQADGRHGIAPKSPATVATERSRACKITRSVALAQATGEYQEARHQQQEGGKTEKHHQINYFFACFGHKIKR